MNIMKSNWTVTNNTPITVYEVSSKGIRHIRTTYPDKRAKADPKRRKGDDKPDKPE